VWKDDPTVTLNITQLAERLQLNRRELKGALDVLLELGIVQATPWRKTRKAYRFNMYITYFSVIDRIYETIPHHRESEPQQYSYYEWKEKMEPLVKKLLPSERLRWYIANLADSTSGHAVARTIYRDSYRRENSPSLSTLEREYHSLHFEDLLMYGVYAFGVRHVLKYFKEHLKNTSA